MTTLFKYIGPLIVAISIDVFDGLISIALFIVFAAAPATALLAAGGGALCGTICAAAGGVLGAVLDIFPVTHGVISAITIPFGEGVGAVLSFGIDATFGSGLIALLIFLNLMSFKDLLSFRSTPFLIAKLIPFFDVLPFYTGMVIMLIIRKEAEKKGGLAGAGITLAAGGAASTAVSAAQNRNTIASASAKNGGRPAGRTSVPMQDIKIPAAAKQAPVAA